MTRLLDTNKRLLAVTGAALLALTLVLAVTLLRTSPADSATAATHDYKYGALSRSYTSSDNVAGWRITPAEMARRSPDLGLEPDATRVVRKTAQATLALVPADVGACLIALRADGSEALHCGTPDDPTAAAVGYGVAVGVVPDEVQSVTFTLSDGSTETQPVKGNLWDAPAEAASVAYTVAGQPKQVDLMPLSSLPKGAVVSGDTVRTAAP